MVELGLHLFCTYLICSHMFSIFSYSYSYLPSGSVCWYMFCVHPFHCGCSHFESWVKMDVILCNFSEFLHANVEIVLIGHSCCHPHFSFRATTVYRICYQPVQLLEHPKNHWIRKQTGTGISLFTIICRGTGCEVDAWGLIPSRDRNFSSHNHILTNSGAQSVTDYEVDDWGLIPSRDRNFSFHHHIQTSSGAQPMTG